MKPTVFASPIAVLAALLYVAAAGASQAQGSNPPKWWQSDLYKRELNLNVPAEEIARRLNEVKQPEPRFKRGVFAKYANTVSSASEGAVTT